MNNENWQKELVAIVKEWVGEKEQRSSHTILESFIRSLLASYSAELCEMLEREKNDLHDGDWDTGFNAGLSRAKELIKAR